MTANPLAGDESSRCAHCGLPVRVSARRAVSHEPAFCCYGCAIVHQLKGGASDESHASWLMSRLGLSLFLAMNVMMLTMILYAPHFFPADTANAALEGQFRSLIHYTLLVLAGPILLLLGVPILRNAVRAGMGGHFGVDALIALGCFAAFGLSAYATFTGGNAIFYETATMVLVLVTFGRYLDARAKISSTKAIEALLAHDIADTGLQPGDEITVLPGATFPVDGVVLRGMGHVNEAMLTGESLPAVKHAGDRVFAGTTSGDGSFVVRVTAAGAERRIAKLARLLDEVRQSRSPIQRLADKAAGAFVPLTAAIALATLIAWTATAGFERGLLSALAVLLIACPCALGIATPLAIWVGIERAARRGIFIRSGEVLEKLALVRTVFFDKTGTLTDATLRLDRIELAHDAGLDENAVLQRIASVEKFSEHPLARAVCAEAARRQLTPLPVTEVTVAPGRGIVGLLGGDGREVVLGTAAFLRERGFHLNGWQSAAEATTIFCGWNGRACARLTFAESARADAAPALVALRRQMLKLRVISGDNPAAARRLGATLGLETRGGLSPEEKVQVVAETAAREPVAMVGDGINDAPALGRACVGIALGGGADVAREAADVTFADNELAKLPWLFALARATRRTIWLNLFWAFAYNAVCLPLAALGLLQPIFAALAMVVSSAFVVGNSMRLRRLSLL
ncbi:MAG: heavy metal translocating P-type ATPase [Verrucomicrobia bacterium]|nr:heavy metal translocating P-type ATPase [Verrucomicrobiota bacterium]